MATRHPLAALLLGLSLALGLAAPGPAAADGAETVVLQLPREAQFRFAGYYAALWQGFYRDAGIAVEIREGGAAIDPAREIAEGHARFGVGDSELLIRTAQGLPLLLLAPIFQRSGAAVYYRADTDYGAPGALAKGTVGRLPASNVLDLEFRAMLQGAGVDPDKLKSAPVGPQDAVAALAGRRVDAVIGSAWDVPWQARQRGLALKAFDPPDDGAAFYGDSLFTLQRFGEAEPALVRRFREASIRGWEYALQNPDRVIARMGAELGGPGPAADRAAFARYQSEIARRLAHYPQAPLGGSSPERWKRIEERLIEIGAAPHPIDLAAFRYDPDARAADGIGWLAAAIAGAVAALAAAVVWRRRRPAALPAPAAGPTDLDAMLAALERPIRRRLPASVGLRLSLPPEPRLCEADTRAVGAAVGALAAEAAAQMPGGGALIVGTRDHSIDDAAAVEIPGGAVGDYVRLTVKDDGPGLSDTSLDGVFDPDATTRPAVVEAGALARRLGGFARVESAEGVGTAVHLYFRRVVAEEEGADETEAEERAQAA